MSKTPKNTEKSLQAVSIHPTRHVSAPLDYGEKRGSPTVRRNSDYVYVNSAYVGSFNSIHERQLQEPPTSVIREQYWTCSKWTVTQRTLAILVCVLLGAVIGLAVTVALRPNTANIIEGIFRSHPAPD